MPRRITLPRWARGLPAVPMLVHDYSGPVPAIYVPDRDAAIHIKRVTNSGGWNTREGIIVSRQPPSGPTAFFGISPTIMGLMPTAGLRMEVLPADFRLVAELSRAIQSGDLTTLSKGASNDYGVVALMGYFELTLSGTLPTTLCNLFRERENA